MDEDSGPRRPFSILIERFLSRFPLYTGTGAIQRHVGYKLITLFTHADNPMLDLMAPAHGLEMG